MLQFILLLIVIVSMTMLVLFGEGDSILGMEPAMFASLVSAGAFAVLALSWGTSTFRGRWLSALRDLLLWLMLLFGLLAGYAYRFELQDVVNRVLAEVAPGYVVVARGGEVTIARSLNGSFTLAGRINGKNARFIFDTGASAVVLTDATARAVGINPDALAFSVAVSTANGRTMAARIRLDRLDIGSITETRVEALVTKPGALFENLLGMSFLERLASYEVRDNRLIMRGGR